MKINHYNDLVAGAGCSVLAIAACRILALGSTVKQAAELIDITPAKAGKLYQIYAQKITDANNAIISQIEQIRDAANAAANEKTRLIRLGKDNEAAAIVVPQIPIRIYTSTCTDHFGRIKKIFPDIDWIQYCICMKLTGLKHPPTRSFLSKVIGITSNMVGKKISDLVEMGAILSYQMKPKPVMSARAFAHHQPYVYDCTLHDIFAHIQNG